MPYICFHETEGGCFPTAAGHELHRQLGPLSSEWHEIVERLRTIDRDTSRTLRFGCNIAYLTGEVSSAISLFCASHPNVWVSTEHSPDYERLWEALATGALDVVLTGEPPRSLGMSCTAIGAGTVCLCMAPTHGLARRKTVSFPSDVACERVVTCIPGGRHTLERYGINPECTVPNLTAIIDLVASGNHVSLAPDQYLAGYISRGCACVPFNRFPENLRSYLVTRPMHDPLVEEFMQPIASQMNAAAIRNRQLLGLG